MNQPVYAISMSQTTAETILNGERSRDLRFQSTAFRGRVYIYTLKSDIEDFPVFQNSEPADMLPEGCIAGSVEIVSCIWDDDEVCFSWLLKNPVRFGKDPLTPYLYPVNKPDQAFWIPVFAGNPAKKSLLVFSE